MLEYLESRQLMSATLSGGILTITGTSTRDDIRVSVANGQVQVTENGVQDQPVDVAQVTGMNIKGLQGADKITLDSSVTMPATIAGGAGIDTVTGGVGGDVIRGNGGNDFLSGGGGNDTIEGGAGNDTVRGQAGDDSLNGGVGNDVVRGMAGNDAIVDTSGYDVLLGGAGDDRFWAQDGAPDLVDGNAGNDTVVTDDPRLDDVRDVETEPAQG